MIDTSKVLPVGTILRSDSHTYTIDKVLGQGGFGITYLATDVVQYGNINVKIKVAIKEHFIERYCGRNGATHAVDYSEPVANEVENSRKDFLSEARRLRDLSKSQNRHPNIVCVNETFEANNTAYFVMEYLDGESLSSYVKRRGSLSDSEMRAIMTPIIDAVAFLHREYITHLDIKPANIMLTRDDNDRLRPVLIDFGLSRHFDPTTDEPSSSIQQAGFSEGYAPVEQVHAFKHFFPGTDVYSLGATMLYALTGQTPMAAENLDDETLRNSIPAGLSASTVAAITEAMHHFRKHRPENAGALFMVLTGGGYTRKYDDEEIIPEIYEPDSKTLPSSKSCQQPTPAPKPTLQPVTVPKTKSKNGLYIIGLGVAVMPIMIGIIVFGIFVYRTFRDDSNLKKQDEAVVMSEELASAEPIGVGFVETTAGLDMKMKLVEGGSFQMGATSEQGSDADDDEKPVHRVTLDSYYISETEVTQAQWEAVMGTTIQEQASKARRPDFYGVGPNYPMYYVSWEEAQAFCDRLSEMTDREYRLPTEAEWEYAARGGKNDDGTKYSGSDSVDDVAWYWENSGNSTQPVKSKDPNSLGLYDMSGNVQEWCSDWYGDYDANDTYNPTGPSSGSFRVLRGGGWFSDARYCRVSSRNSRTPDYRFGDFGFRVVAVLP